MERRGHVFRWFQDGRLCLRWDLDQHGCWCYLATGGELWHRRILVWLRWWCLVGDLRHQKNSLRVWAGPVAQEDFARVMALVFLNVISLGIPVSQNIGRSIGNIVFKDADRDNSTMEHMAYGIPLELVQEKLLYFGRSPPWRYSVIVSDISSGSIYGIYFMTFYSSLLSDILFWHSFLAFYLAPILTSYLASFLASILTFSLAFYLAFFLIIYLVSILTLYPASLLAFYLAFSLTVYSGILPGIYSDILFYHSFWHSFWHILWHPIWHMVNRGKSFAHGPLSSTAQSNVRLMW